MSGTFDLSHVNVKAMEKGSVIPVAVVEKVVRLSKDHKEYSLKVMSLCSYVKAEVSKKYGSRVMVTSEKGEVRVLTDVQAAQRSVSNYESGRKKMFEAYQDKVSVDVTDFTPTQKETHDGQALLMGKELQAVKKARRKFQPKPCRYGI